MKVRLMIILKKKKTVTEEGHQVHVLGAGGVSPLHACSMSSIFWPGRLLRNVYFIIIY